MDGSTRRKAKELVRAADEMREEADKRLTARVSEAVGATKSDSFKAVSNVPKTQAATAALPVVLELIGMVEDFGGDKRAVEDRKRRRAELQHQVTAIARRAGEGTMPHWARTWTASGAVLRAWRRWA